MKHKLRVCLEGGLRKGLRTGWWMTKMMLPITLAMALLKWVGLIDLLSESLTPLFAPLGLTTEGVLVFLTACFSNLYSAIAVIATLDVDYRMTTILAVMGLICHNLIVETVIQRKAGANGVFIVVLRVTAAVVAAWGMNIIIPAGYTGTVIVERAATTAANNGFWGAVNDWGWSMIRLLPYMFALIIALNVLQQVLREFNLIRFLTAPLLPLMRVLGLSGESSFLWIVLNTLGLAYGGAVLIGEVENGEIGCREAKLLNTHAAINHSLLEDTLLFMAIGINVFWLVVPRVVLAILAVWGQRLMFKINKKWQLQTSK